ncbi:protocadherin alpha-8-like [Echinops telfairi]|uniref:Protocadherin alpha-8-like n=1 Tax=Echinops telfairi TaxID=9371 RepID=A0ABM1VN70_ECHTE|nr:protocadherin alpha-8-like [Echinops telfairi]
MERKRLLEMVFFWHGTPGSWRLMLWLLLLLAWEVGSGQLHYSVPEEAKHGTFVGRIAQDLGLELAELVPRLFRVESKDRGDLLEVNLQNGILFVNSRIDREELCGRSAACGIHLEVIVEQPLQVFHVEVEVKDINDNPPLFPVTEQKLFVSESRMPDSRFPLEGASDADIGTNSILTYKLSSSDYFTLDVNSKNEENKQVELVLRKSLDREEAREHNLVLTATDGGKPELTGTVQLQVTVLDVNDNAPSFQQSEYQVRIFENADIGTVVIRLNASDQDEGVNKDISYSFNSLVPAMVLAQFSIDPNTGEVVIKKNLDYEKVTSYKIRIDATDKGHPPMAGHCTLLVKVLDINDNVPQITLTSLVVTSLSLPVREDAPLGTVIALFSVSDRDSGANGQVTCSLTPTAPFKLVSTFKNYYSLVLDSALDRESVAAYELEVTARDGGSPPLSATAHVSVEVADVNDNAPAFAQAEYTVFVKENNPPGSHPALVCSSAVGSWSSSQQRRPRVCSGEGPPKTDLMAFSPSLPPALDRQGEERSETGSNHCGQTINKPISMNKIFLNDEKRSVLETKQNKQMN